MKKRKIIALSLGYQLLTGVAVGIVQAVTLIMGMHSTTINWVVALITPIFGAPFNTGGFTVRLIFEALVEPLESVVGHRSATVLSNLPFYLVLLLIQMTVLTLILFWGYRRTGGIKNRITVIVLMLVLTNGLMNIMWPWWGT